MEAIYTELAKRTHNDIHFTLYEDVDPGWNDFNDPTWLDSVEVAAHDGRTKIQVCGRSYYIGACNHDVTWGDICAVANVYAKANPEFSHFRLMIDGDRDEEGVVLHLIMAESPI